MTQKLYFQSQDCATMRIISY